MRFVLCDDDQLFTSMVEAMLNDVGHEVVGVATTTAASVALVEAARPDVVIADISLGFNTDFDIVESAIADGAATILFSYTIDDALLSHYPVRPLVVFKPDLPELEQVVRRLERSPQRGVVEHERRTRPERVIGGSPPADVADARAFYEAVNEAAGGDALISLDLPEEYGAGDDARKTAMRVRDVLRTTDRLVASASSVRIFLPGADQTGIQSFLARLDEVGGLPDGTTVRSIVVAPEEPPSAAFDRLKQA
jgi:CheY-like chemotaxis protein